MAYNKKLMCEVVRIEYNFDSKIGALFMPAYNCTDMSGCIAMFKKIDPDVMIIRTIAGGINDTRYERKSKREPWAAHLP